MKVTAEEALILEDALDRALEIERDGGWVFMRRRDSKLAGELYLRLYRYRKAAEKRKKQQISRIALVGAGKV